MPPSALKFDLGGLPRSFFIRWILFTLTANSAQQNLQIANVLPVALRGENTALDSPSHRTKVQTIRGSAFTRVLSSTGGQLRVYHEEGIAPFRHHQPTGHHFQKVVRWVRTGRHHCEVTSGIRIHGQVLARAEGLVLTSWLPPNWAGFRQLVGKSSLRTYLSSNYLILNSSRCRFSFS